MTTDASEVTAPRTPGRRLVGLLLLASACARPESLVERKQEPSPTSNPPAFAIRERLPDYVTGDECLFCHRATIGTEWPTNAHQRTLREEGDQLVLGAGSRTRTLRRTGDHGRLEIRAQGAKDLWLDTFGPRCAGCHATGVDAERFTFTDIALDCFVCHGDLEIEHSREPASALLSPRTTPSPALVASICGQCHIRTGISRSRGTPFPVHFVAGDTLDDLDFDSSDAALAGLSPNDRHVLLNVREALDHSGNLSCLSCHRVHDASTARHRRLDDASICRSCHDESGEIKPAPPDHSETCEY